MEADTIRPYMRKMKKTIHTESAPKAVGPYSQGVETGGTLYVSGQLPLDPLTGTMPERIGEQTEQALKNIGAILREAGYDYADVVKTTVLLTDLDDFAAMNGVYATFFAENPPARAAYQVVRLPLGARVEIEAVAVKD